MTDCTPGRKVRVKGACRVRFYDADLQFIAVYGVTGKCKVTVPSAACAYELLPLWDVA